MNEKSIDQARRQREDENLNDWFERDFYLVLLEGNERKKNKRKKRTNQQPLLGAIN